MSEQPDPGPGWRWLERGESLQAWDEICEKEKFCPVDPTYVGYTVYISKTFRRRIPIDEPQPDLVNAPPHYRQGRIECIDAIRAALTDDEFRGFCKGNAIKYAWRERNKSGDQDLQKAAWYLERLTKEKTE